MKSKFPEKKVMYQMKISCSLAIDASSSISVVRPVKI